MKSSVLLIWPILSLIATPLFAQPRPTVSIIEPVNGTVIAPGWITFRADAADMDGFIERVVYFVDDGFQGESGAPPFEVSYFATDGRHSVRAIAYDDVGYFTISKRIYFQVGEGLPVNLFRGPYLQSCTQTSIVVRWRTDWPTNSVVGFGTNFSAMTAAITNEARTNEHVVKLAGLIPDTVYFYAIGSSTETFAINVNQKFRTAPTNTRPVSVWIIGDSGTADADAEQVRDTFLNKYGPENTDVWLMLGDNAYEAGSDDEYQDAVFRMYPDILRSLPLWPTIGNHDGEPLGGLAYLEIFTLPEYGEGGGQPSGTKNYYSFDYANIHFICLDSYLSSRATNSPMLTWLARDLAATEKDWIVAFWHHPPYSFGSHNADTEIEMVQMRQNFLPMLESFGVDLVLAGHNHFYDRSMLLNGHYGQSTSLSSNMILDASPGRDASAYRKPAGGLGAGGGTVYAVCGNSGEGAPGPAGMLHPTTAFKTNGTGFMMLNFNGLRLDAQFIDADGLAADYFAIDKSAPATVPPRLKITRTTNSVNLSWPTSLPMYSLQTAPVIATNAAWQIVTNAVTSSGRWNIGTIHAADTNAFFRLRAGGAQAD
jgi:acid phosphatase type 7